MRLFSLYSPFLLFFSVSLSFGNNERVLLGLTTGQGRRGEEKRRLGDWMEREEEESRKQSDWSVYTGASWLNEGSSGLKDRQSVRQEDRQTIRQTVGSTDILSRSTGTRPPHGQSCASPLPSPSHLKVFVF